MKDFGPIADMMFERQATRIGVDADGFFEYWRFNDNIYRRTAHGAMRWECTVGHWNGTIGNGSKRTIAEAKMTGSWAIA